MQMQQISIASGVQFEAGTNGAAISGAEQKGSLYA